MDDFNSQSDRLLGYARREGKEIIVSRNYGNVAVFRVLMKAGLQFSSWRFAQFDEVCESLRNDPDNLVRKGLEIIRAATYVARNQD